MNYLYFFDTVSLKIYNPQQLIIDENLKLNN